MIHNKKTPLDNVSLNFKENRVVSNDFVPKI
jgi:thiamine pyrophosphokinase